MATGSIVVEGLPELQAALEDLGTVKVPKAMRKIVSAGARIVRAAVKEAAPVGQVARPTQKDVPGNLQKSVRYKASRGSGGTRYVIGAFGGGSAHRALVIYGHEIKGHKQDFLGVRFGHRKTAAEGSRTRANNFVERGRLASQALTAATVEVAAKEAFNDIMHLSVAADE